MIDTVEIPVTTTGVAGSAAGTGVTNHPVNGRILAVHLDYTTQPATTDVTLSMAGTPSQTILTVSNANADGWFYPRALLDDEAGAALTAVYDAFPVNGVLQVSVAQGDAVANAVVATILVERN